jgi:hypothetical protein
LRRSYCARRTPAIRKILGELSRGSRVVKWIVPEHVVDKVVSVRIDTPPYEITTGWLWGWLNDGGWRYVALWLFEQDGTLVGRGYRSRQVVNGREVGQHGQSRAIA